MGIKDFLEEAAGGFAAEKGLDAVDPNANFLEKGLAAVAGFEGVKVVKDHFDGEQTQDNDAAPVQGDSWNSDTQASDDTQPVDDSQSGDSQNN